MVKDQYITHEQAAANHLALSIQQVKVELKYMDGRDLNPKEMIYFEQMVKLLADLEAEHGRALGIRISP